MINTLTMTADANTKLCDVVKRHDVQSYAATIFFDGNDGGGTWTLQVSPDGGTTKYTVKDVSGNNVTGTSAAYHSFVLGGDSGKNSGSMTLYVDLTGSTGANLKVYNFDNR